MNTPDGIYNRSNITTAEYGGAYSQQRPWASNEERLMSQALSVADIPGYILQQQVRPPLPQIVLFPDRFGVKHVVPGIASVIGVDRIYNDFRTDWSGGPAGYSGSSRNTLGNV
jgi:hypothetical protein